MSNETETQLPATVPARKSQDIRVVSDPIPVLDTARFEHMQRIATVMANSSLVPTSLTLGKVGDRTVQLEPQQIAANCFLVVNQAVRWGFDPFAVAQCVSVVHGKLCYEGKLIAAVLSAKLGVDLEYEFSGKEDDDMKVVVTASRDGKPEVDSNGKRKTIEGTVGEWKTSGNGSPWGARGGYKRMLRYRGAREWCRVYAPSLMLGVYGEDELTDLAEEQRARKAVDVSPNSAPSLPPPTPKNLAERLKAISVRGDAAPTTEIESPPTQTADVGNTAASLPADGLEIPAELRRVPPPSKHPAKPTAQKKEPKKAPEKAPDPAEEPGAFLKWAQGILSSASDPNILGSLWDDEVYPKIRAVEDAQHRGAVEERAGDLYRRREKELTPSRDDETV